MSIITYNGRTTKIVNFILTFSSDLETKLISLMSKVHEDPSESVFDGMVNSFLAGVFKAS